MSRPASCSGVYGLTPATGSVVDFWKYSGTISTKPPTLISRMMPTTIQPMFFSRNSWVSFIVRPLRVRRHERRDRCIDGLAAADRADDVPGHDQHAGEEQNAAEQPDRVERIRRLHALDEGVRERAVGVDRSPHEPLH